MSTIFATGWVLQTCVPLMVGIIEMGTRESPMEEFWSLQFLAAQPSSCGEKVDKMMPTAYFIHTEGKLCSTGLCSRALMFSTPG